MDYFDLSYIKIKEAIETISQEGINDIYVLSFLIENEDDDPRMPTLTLGFNTNQNMNSSTEDASDADEAKWNYAFWLQNELYVMGREDDEENRNAWVKSLGHWYTDEEEDEDFDRCMEIGEKITQCFIEIAQKIAMKLHNEDVIKNIFGKDIPIIIHEYEY